MNEKTSPKDISLLVDFFHSSSINDSMNLNQEWKSLTA